MFYFGAPGTFIRPTLSYTGSCAGVGYNMQCPYYDLEQNLEYCSVGLPTEPVSLRVVREDNEAEKADTNEVGCVLLSGSPIFERYHNNALETWNKLTYDGW
jgi:hypothetical protein